jgi:hypothetical protein
VVGALSDEAGPAPSSVSQKAANHQRAATAVAVAPRPEMNAPREVESWSGWVGDESGD